MNSSTSLRYSGGPLTVKRVAALLKMCRGDENDAVHVFGLGDKLMSRDKKRKKRN